MSAVVSKVIDLVELLELRAGWRLEDKPVVWTNGCFDLFHVGHLRSLQTARRLGDQLIVGVNSDASVRKLKGPTRPILPEEERAELLAGLECVSRVILFDELTPETIIARLRPDICCKGADYAPPHGKPAPEIPLVESYGGRISFLPLIGANSTSAMVRRIQNLSGALSS